MSILRYDLTSNDWVIFARRGPAGRTNSRGRPLFRYMGGCGAHEVIIESPDHGTSMT